VPVKVEETKSKASDKKVPKHVREMQERLARVKEAEERRIQGMMPFRQMLVLVQNAFSTQDVIVRIWLLINIYEVFVDETVCEEF